jgi:hypothetical protein
MVTPFFYLALGGRKWVLLAMASAANSNDRTMNNGAPINVEVRFSRKIRKNTMPFQAKAKLRKVLIHMSVLATGVKNTR